jgi:hypothetical protein
MKDKETMKKVKIDIIQALQGQCYSLEEEYNLEDRELEPYFLEIFNFIHKNIK